jgi:predicted nucleic acid-binding protein
MYGQGVELGSASFAVMRERAIGEALTSDHHFEQAGFKKLL